MSVVEINYYEILGVSPGSTDEEIRSAFRKLASEFHPDKGGDAEEFHSIKEAYDTLIDHGKRKIYDYFDGHNIDEIREAVIMIFKESLKEEFDSIESGFLEVSEAICNQIDQERITAEKDIMNHTKILKRIKKSPTGMDFLGDDIRRVIKNIEDQKDELKRRKGVIQKAQEFLIKEYVFVSDDESTRCLNNWFKPGEIFGW